MKTDRSQIAKLVAAAASLEVVALNPADASQDRQQKVRRIAAEAAKASDRRPVLVIVVEQ